MYREEDQVDVVATYGLEPYLRQWLDGTEHAWLPLCPESWAGNRIPDDREDEAQEVLVGACPYIEELLLAGDVGGAADYLSMYPQRCSETGEEDPSDWPPGIYLHYLRRLVTGDSPRTVYEDLRRVEAGLDGPVVYLEVLRRQLGQFLDPPAEVPETAPSSPPRRAETTAFPAWESRDAWLLVGEPAESKGFLAYDGKKTGAVPPQVFKLLLFLRGKRKSLSLKEAVGEGIVSGTTAKKAADALRQVISRANRPFRTLGASKEEKPLHFKENACHSTVEIRHAPSASRVQ